MKNFCFILAGSEDRGHHLQRCVSCLKNSKYKDADVFLFWQGSQDVPEKDFFKGIIFDTELRGIFTPRYELMKAYSLNYDFTILIDDDCFLYQYTSYDLSMDFLSFEPLAGAVSLGRHFDKVRPEIRMIDYSHEEFNVNGGLVLPRKSVQIILDYFSDKEQDYTEDVFWLLLWIKGYDLYRDFSSKASHTCNQKGKNGEISGFRKMRYEKPRIPLLPEYVTERYEFSKMHKRWIYVTPEVKDINEAGRAERNRCRAKMEGYDV